MQIAEKAPVQLLEHHSPSTNVGNDEEPPAFHPSSDNVAPQPAKRPTRQWAAWTREEEEVFSLHCDKILKRSHAGCKVKTRIRSDIIITACEAYEQVIGSGLSLDAKDSKDTNAAMLRWWSLLEKYSCKASKLHLKPRRFKIFVEALKKDLKKRAVQGENCSSPPTTNTTTTTTNQNKLSGNDARAVKTVVVDSQNVQKAGQGRGTSTKRNSNMGVIRSNYKGESSQTKPPRQRRKSGAVSAAAIKRWEKAAMAGVSLVADAAEHLERTAGQVQANSSNLFKGAAVEENVQATYQKGTGKDKLNPHLELTLSSRKKISSVLEHLDRKWGTSSVATGELVIFPFNIQRENLLRHQRWTRDSVVTAAEVYAMIGSPPLFRLRYGWISHTELQLGSSDIVPSSFNVQEYRRKQALKEQSLPPTEEKDRLAKLVSHILSNHQTLEKQNNSFEESTAAIISGEANKNVDVDFQNKVFMMPSLGSNALTKRNEACEKSVLTNMEEVSDQRASKNSSVSGREWDDNLQMLLLGGHQLKFQMLWMPTVLRLLFSKVLSVLSRCHSLVTHLMLQLLLIYLVKRVASWNPSTFTARNLATAAASVAGADFLRMHSAGTNTKVQDSVETPMAEKNVLEDPMDECPSETHETESSAKDFSSLTDIYWPDSLGPLELDVPTCKYYSEDLILSDSMSGLNRLLASSLDAFQNCPFFGSDDKGPLSAATGAQGGTSFAGKIGTSDKAGISIAFRD
ncbi:TSL-kinase interacting protein 1 [Bienertia sinuspersici]